MILIKFFGFSTAVLLSAHGQRFSVSRLQMGFFVSLMNCQKEIIQLKVLSLKVVRLGNALLEISYFIKQL